MHPLPLFDTLHAPSTADPPSIHTRNTTPLTKQGLRGEGEPEDAAYDADDAGQRAARLKVAEGMWRALPAAERREFVIQAEQGARGAAVE